MKKQVATTFRTILIVLAVVLLIITAVIYFIDTPVVEEGQEPTVAQKIILTGKKYLAEILLALGVSGVTLIAAFVKLIYNSANRTAAQSNTTAADVAELRRDNAELRAENRKQYELIMQLMEKQDIANNVLLTTFSLSELPRSLREQIHNAMTEYNGVGKVKEIIEQVVDEPKNAVENAEQPATADITPVKEQADDKRETPVYL